MAGQPVGVDQAAQQAEQLWNALHFIKDHQPAALPLEVQLGITEPGLIAGGFEVEIDRIQPGTELAGQGGLADLSRPQQHDGCKLTEPLCQQTRLDPLNPHGD